MTDIQVKILTYPAKLPCYTFYPTLTTKKRKSKTELMVEVNLEIEIKEIAKIE